jgi:hypothetical protein
MTHSASFSTCLRFLLAALFCLICTRAFAQADYTTDLPSVARVESEIQGSDPTDTLARQTAVFTYLQTYIDRAKYGRTVTGPYTQGEITMRAAYGAAAAQLSQDYAKSHTAAEVSAFSQLQGRYELDETFNDAWQKQLIGPQATAAYNGAVSSMAAGEAAHVAQEQQQYQQDTAAQQTSGNVMSNDPTSVAARRCLELGGTTSACLGSSLLDGIVNLFTGGAGLGALTGPGRAGVVLSGIYHTAGAATSLNFTGDTTGIGGCSDLQEVSSPYTISKSSAATQVILQSTPTPVTLSMRSDGSLTGPALVNITGQVITGYNTVTSTQMINGARTAPNQCNGPCQTISQVPIYAAKTVRCSLASFAPPPPPPPPSASSSDSSPLGGLFGAITGAVGTVVSLPGLRMEGKYTSSSGLLLDFAGDAVTMDCGQAHVKAPCTVVNSPASFTVNVQNPGGPFTLTMSSNSTLGGSGSTTVNGRLVSGMNGDNVTFTPHSESCAVATFTPQSAASSSTVAAPAATVAAVTPAAAAPAPKPAPAATVSPSAATAAGVSVTSTFPTATNPLAGKPVTLMTDRFDSALRSVGAPIPPGTTPGHALQAWAYACNPPKDCTAAAKLMAKYYVGRGTFDSSGKVVLTAPVAPGSYYVFTSVAGTKGVLVWDLPATLKAGDNTINLTATNAELVQITPAQ